LEAVRRQAVALHEQGLSPAEIGEVLDRSQRTIEKWIKIATEQGIESLAAKAHPGATPKLTPEQREELRARLVAGALAAGFDTEIWTAPRVRELIQRLYRVTFHVRYVPCVLRSLGFSCQRPQLRPRERDQSAIERWIARDWPRIKKKRGSRTRTSPLSMKAACS
jgi:transposase